MIDIKEIKKDYMLKNFLNYEKVERSFNKIIEDKSIICRLFPDTENIFKEIFDNLEKLEWKAKDYLDKRKNYKNFSFYDLNVGVVSDFLKFVNFREDLRLLSVKKIFFETQNELSILCEFTDNRNMYVSFLDVLRFTEFVNERIINIDICVLAIMDICALITSKFNVANVGFPVA